MILDYHTCAVMQMCRIPWDLQDSKKNPVTCWLQQPLPFHISKNVLWSFPFMMKIPEHPNIYNVNSLTISILAVTRQPFFLLTWIFPVQEIWPSHSLACQDTTPKLQEWITKCEFLSHAPWSQDSGSSDKTWNDSVLRNIWRIGSNRITFKRYTSGQTFIFFTQTPMTTTTPLHTHKISRLKNATDYFTAKYTM